MHGVKLEPATIQGVFLHSGGQPVRLLTFDKKRLEATHVLENSQQKESRH